MGCTDNSTIVTANSPGNPNSISSGNVSLNAPTNQVGPYYKEVDTIPPGENRVVFGPFGAGANQVIFTTQKSVTIEIPEVFFQSTGGNVVTLLVNGVAMTPALELADAMAYDDSGFLLAVGLSVALTITGGGTVAGFLRWRYS